MSEETTYSEDGVRRIVTELINRAREKTSDGEVSNEFIDTTLGRCRIW